MPVNQWSEKELRRAALRIVEQLEEMVEERPPLEVRIAEIIRRARVARDGREGESGR